VILLYQLLLIFGTIFRLWELTFLSIMFPIMWVLYQDTLTLRPYIVMFLIMLKMWGRSIFQHRNMSTIVALLERCTNTVSLRTLFAQVSFYFFYYNHYDYFLMSYRWLLHGQYVLRFVLLLTHYLLCLVVSSYMISQHLM